MDRYFKVSELAADVQNTKAELDSLGKRLTALKRTVLSYAVDAYDLQPSLGGFRAAQTNFVAKHSYRFVYDSELKFREMERSRRSRRLTTPSKDDRIGVKDDLHINLDMLRARVAELRNNMNVATLKAMPPRPEPTKIEATKNKEKSTTKNVRKRTCPLPQRRPRRAPPKRPHRSVVGGHRRCTVCQEKNAPPSEKVQRPKLSYQRFRQRRGELARPSVAINQRVTHVAVPDLYRIRRRYELPQNALAKDASVQKTVIDHMRNKYFGNMGMSCVYRIIDDELPSAMKNTRVASVQTTCQLHSDNKNNSIIKNSKNGGISLASSYHSAARNSSGSVARSAPKNQVNGVSSNEMESPTSSRSSVLIDLRANSSNSDKGVVETGSAATEVPSEESVKHLSNNPSTNNSSNTPTTNNHNVIYGDTNNTTVEADGNARLWRQIHVKAIAAYYEVQIALLTVEKTTSGKGLNKNDLYFEERIENLRRKMDEEIRDYQASNFSVVDEINAVGHLQQMTTELQKRITELCTLIPRTDIDKIEKKTTTGRTLRKRQRMQTKDNKHIVDDERESTTSNSNGDSSSNITSLASDSYVSPTKDVKNAAPNDEQPTPVSGRSEHMVHIQALKEHLQERKEVARKLSFEYAIRSQEHLKSYEQSLEKQVQIYKDNISKTEQLIAELESNDTSNRLTQPSGSTSKALARNLDELLKSDNACE